MVNCYEPDKPSQMFVVEGTLLIWLGVMKGECQVVGVKAPVGPQELHMYLHVGPPGTLVGTRWIKEFVSIGT